MFKILLLITVAFYTNSSKAQKWDSTFKFNAHRLVSISKDKNNEVSNFIDFGAIHGIIFIDMKKYKMTLNLDTLEIKYNLTSFDEIWTDEQKNSWIKLKGIDREGHNCGVRIEYVNDKNVSGLARLYLDYKEFTEIYFMKAE